MNNPGTSLRRFLPLCLLVFAPPAPAAGTPRDLWDAWDGIRVFREDPYALRHAELLRRLTGLAERFPGLLTTLEEGVSSEERRIPLLSAGRGKTKVLLWSQMHGDEPTATSALLDVLAFLGTNRDAPQTKLLLDRLTLLVIPMLNPDGAERTRRVNAQGIDINRDALRLSTPEGRFLKSVRDRYQPAAGYNLHNHAALTTAGPGGDQVAISLLSVPFDEAFTENEGRKLTKRLAVKVRLALEPFAKGKIARYDTDYTARAFGDSMTRWGTPTLLIESGGWNGPDEPGTLVRLNFVALVSTLQALADGSLASIDAAAYETIPLLKRDSLFDVVVRNAMVLNGNGLPPYLADVGLVKPSRFGGMSGRTRAGVVEVGDLTEFRGKTEIDATGLVLAPAPPGGPDAWSNALEALKTRGLADKDGRLLLSPEALSLRVRKWTPEGAFLAPGFSGDLLLFRREGETTLVYERRIATN
jgi:hypothetical protein